MTVLNDIDEIVKRVLEQDHYAIARAISLIEAEGEGRNRLFEAFLPHIGKAVVIGVTGPPGVGKSTLVDALIVSLRAADRTLGVLAVDPSSPVSGGAILGDRIRMRAAGTDSKVYIRSLAARGHLGGLSTATFLAINVLDASGKEVVIVETVGTGQSETEISRTTDVNILVLAPGSGDEVQAMKSGILETADLLLVNKSDLPEAGRAASQLKAMLKLRKGARASTPLLLASAQNREGIDDVIAVINRIAGAADRGAASERISKRLKLLLTEIALQVVRDEITARPDGELYSILEGIKEGRRDLDGSVDLLLGRSEAPESDDRPLSQTAE